VARTVAGDGSAAARMQMGSASRRRSRDIVESNTVCTVAAPMTVIPARQPCRVSAKLRWRVCEGERPYLVR
jgi:hypothetical protein